MEPRRYTFTACLTWGGDIQTGEAEVECSYRVAWGRPATGPSYASGGEPADPDEIDDLRILTVDGKPWTVVASAWKGLGLTFADATDTLVNKLEMDCYDEMLSAAYEAAADDYAEAMERLNADSPAKAEPGGTG